MTDAPLATALVADRGPHAARRPRPRVGGAAPVQPARRLDTGLGRQPRRRPGRRPAAPALVGPVAVAAPPRPAAPDRPHGRPTEPARPGVVESSPRVRQRPPTPESRPRRSAIAGQ